MFLFRVGGLIMYNFMCINIMHTSNEIKQIKDMLLINV